MALIAALGASACTPLRPLDPIEEMDAARPRDVGAGIDARLDATSTDAASAADAPGIDALSLDARVVDAASAIDAPPDAYVDPGDAGMGCAASPRGLTCTTPGVRAFTVPAGVSLLRVLAAGAGGGGYLGTDRHVGGDGSAADQAIVVTPGTMVWLVVGAGGGPGSMGCSPPAGGGGGGMSGVVSVAGDVFVVAAGGGGASLRADGCDADGSCGTSTDDRASLSGGGGGRGSGWPGGRGGRSTFTSQPGHGGESAVSVGVLRPTPGPAGGAAGMPGQDGSLTLEW